MTKQEISIAQLRLELANVVNSVRYRGDTVFVTKNNQRAAVIVSPEVYERLLDPSKRLTKPERQSLADELDQLRATIPDINPTTLQRAVDSEVTAMRHAKRSKPSARKTPSNPTANA